MKIAFDCEDGLLAGIGYLSQELGYTVSDAAEAVIVVNAKPADEDTVRVTLSGRRAEIVYGGGKTRFFRGLAILADALRTGKSGMLCDEHPLFQNDGAMVDMSRNAVMRTDTVKMMLRKMAMMGLNTFMLYTEDTYEVEGRPWVGYKRGRYSAAEIREMDAYALALGIELVPCIQLLGHLRTFLRWAASGPVKDTAAVLLAGEEETYRLIEDMLQSVAAGFTSRRLHMGMDETHDLGLGAYLTKNGYHERQEIFFAHLQRVTEMAKKYGFRPMMWSDMFFRMDGAKLQGLRDYDVRTVLSEDTVRRLPEGVQPVFWDYYHADEEFYAVNLEKHKRFPAETVFAGGVWAWSGYGVQFSRSIRNTRPALEACRKAGIRDVIATVWHNNAMSDLRLSLAGLAFYASYDYTGRWDEAEIRSLFARTCFADYDAVLLTEAVEYPGTPQEQGSASIPMLFNDPILGLWDKNIEAAGDVAGYYRELTLRLEDADPGDPVFSPGYRVIIALSSLLENKADFGLRLRAARKAEDRDALSSLAEECDVICEKIEDLRRAHFEAWHSADKGNGWEVLDIRYGGLEARFDTVRTRIGMYLAGEDGLEDLLEDSMRMDGEESGMPFPGGTVWTGWGACVTAGVL